MANKPYLTDRERAAMANRLKAARHASGMTEQGAADKIGVLRSTVQRWERGSVPKPHSRKRIARVYGIPTDRLFREFNRRLEAALRDTNGRSST